MKVSKICLGGVKSTERVLSWDIMLALSGFTELTLSGAQGPRVEQPCEGGSEGLNYHLRGGSGRLNTRSGGFVRGGSGGLKHLLRVVPAGLTTVRGGGFPRV